MKYGIKRKQPDVHEPEEPSGKRKRNQKQSAAFTSQNEPNSRNKPQLPPEVRETDRMLAVQRWINGIPHDSRPWAQINLDRIVTLESPYDFPVYLHQRMDCPFKDCYECVFEGQTEIFNQSLHAPSTYIHMDGCACNKASDVCSLFQEASSAIIDASTVRNEVDPNLANSKSHRISPTVHHYASAAPRQALKIYEQPWPMPQHAASYEKPGEDEFAAGSSRLYSEKEVQMIVKCFWDYFQKGDLPPLKEIRTRLSRSSLEATRGANSIRLKLKRLQTSGRWTDYSNLV